MAFAEDLSVFFQTAEFALAATWGALTANVILDMPTEDVLGGQSNSNEYMAMLRSSDFPDIARGASIAINSVNYKVREVRLLDDGAVKALLLSKV